MAPGVPSPLCMSSGHQGPYKALPHFEWDKTNYKNEKQGGRCLQRFRESGNRKASL